jgi:hypothetical protein
MKAVRIFTLSSCLLALFILSSAFSVPAQEQAALEEISSDIAELSNSMMEDIQTTTATLEGTVWEVNIVSVITLQTSKAIFTFNDGMLTIGNWIIALNPGPYEEALRRKSISFTAMLEKPGVFPLVFEVQGFAKPGRTIAGLLHNVNTNMFYIFIGKPLLLPSP